MSIALNRVRSIRRMHVCTYLVPVYVIRRHDIVRDKIIYLLSSRGEKKTRTNQHLSASAIRPHPFPSQGIDLVNLERSMPTLHMLFASAGCMYTSPSPLPCAFCRAYYDPIYLSYYLSTFSYLARFYRSPLSNVSLPFIRISRLFFSILISVFRTSLAQADNAAIPRKGGGEALVAGPAPRRPCPVLSGSGSGNGRLPSYPSRFRSYIGTRAS